MNKPKKGKVATEGFVWELHNELYDQMEIKFTEKEQKDEERYHKIMNILTDLLSKYKKFEEEHAVLADRQANHSDRIEKLEKKVFSPVS